MGVPQLVRVAGYMKRRPPFLKQHVVPEFGPRGALLSPSLYLIYRASLGAHCLLFPLHVVSLGHFLNSFHTMWRARCSSSLPIDGNGVMMSFVHSKMCKKLVDLFGDAS